MAPSFKKTRPTSQAPVLTLSNVNAGYRRATVVHDINFELARQECLALVGESGSGNSVSVMTLMGLTRGENARFEGSALFGGVDLIAASDLRTRARPAFPSWLPAT